MMKKVLVTGGTGYIGSHTVVELIQKDFEVVIIDDLSNSQAFIIDRIEQITGTKPKFHSFSLLDRSKLSTCLANEGKIDAVIHFAAFKAIGESFEQPLSYYENNLVGLLNILSCCEEFNINQFVFSSSASVYGLPNELPLKETTPLNRPTNPYGKTKLMCEMILEDYASAHPEFKAIFLRYFNPIGAHESSLIGEFPQGKPNNLLPYITQTVTGKRDQLTVFGADYDTKDGTCLRDYIHVVDLAEAHILSYEFLSKTEQQIEVFNLGLGEGLSVLDIIHTFEQVNQEKVNYKMGERRNGDVPKLYTDTTKARNILGWVPKRSLAEMVKSAWVFEKQLDQLT